MICWQESLWTAELEYSVNLWPTNAIYVCVCVYIYIYIYFFKPESNCRSDLLEG